MDDGIHFRVRGRSQRSLGEWQKQVAALRASQQTEDCRPDEATTAPHVQLFSQLAEVRREMHAARSAFEAGLAAETTQREASEEVLWAALKQQGSGEDGEAHESDTQGDAPMRDETSASAAPTAVATQVLLRSPQQQQQQSPVISSAGSGDITDLAQRICQTEATLADMQGRLTETSLKLAKVDVVAVEELEQRCTSLKDELSKLSEQKADNTTLQDMLSEQKFYSVGLEGRLLEERAEREQQYSSLVEALEALRSYMKDSSRVDALAASGAANVVAPTCPSQASTATIVPPIDIPADGRWASDGTPASASMPYEAMANLTPLSAAAERASAELRCRPPAEVAAAAAAAAHGEDALREMHMSLQAFQIKLEERHASWATDIQRRCQEAVDAAIEEMVAMHNLQTSLRSHAVEEAAGRAAAARTEGMEQFIERELHREREARSAQCDALRKQIKDEVGYASFLDRLHELDRRLEQATQGCHEAIQKKVARLWEAISTPSRGSGAAHPAAPAGAGQLSARVIVKAPQTSSSRTSITGTPAMPLPCSSFTAAPTIPSPASSPMSCRAGGGGQSAVSPPVPLLAMMTPGMQANSGRARPASAGSTVRRQTSSPGILVSHTTRSSSPLGQGHTSLISTLPRASSVPQRHQPQAWPSPSMAHAAAAAVTAGAANGVRVTAMNFHGASSAPVGGTLLRRPS